MKRIIFPATSRVHLARQKSLLDELSKDFDVDIFTPTTPNSDLESFSILSAVEFKNFLAGRHYDLALVRADRMELLLLSGILAYRGVKIAHIEGGADSGARVIDTRIRDALTMLADIHLVTDEKARKRVASLGAEHIYNVGSLDVSFAKQVPQNPEKREPYILFLHHEIPGEESEPLYEALSTLNIPIKGVKSNQDYKTSLMTESYGPEEFLSLLYHASVFVSNSSAACKEASILGTPTVLVGSRQDGRVAGWNAVRVPHDAEEVKRAAQWQMLHGRFKPDHIYYKPQTEKEIVKILKTHL